MCFGSAAEARAMKVAPAASARAIGLIANSMAPSGENELM